RRTQYELERAEARAHILEGLLIAVANLDEVVAIIRGSRTREDAAARLMERFSLSREQTAAILEMRLHQLTGLAIEDLQKEYDALRRQISHLKELLGSRDLRMGVVRAELLEIRERYADARRTRILAGERELGIEDLIAQSLWVVTMSASGYIKRLPEDAFQLQNRGGVGIRGMQTRDEEDEVQHLLTAMTHDYVLFFTNQGQMHWLKTYEIPEGARDGRGRALVNLLELAEGEQVRAVMSVCAVDNPELAVVMATRNGIVKKTRLDAFRNLRHRGIRAIILEEGDDLIDAKLTDGDQEILLSSRAGRACRFQERDIRTMGRASRGVHGMNLAGPDGNRASEVVSMTVVNPDADLLVITARGIGKRSRLGTGVAADDAEISGGGYRLTRRGSKGVISIRLREGDEVVEAVQLEEDMDVILTSVKGQVVRINTREIRPLGRNSRGVIVMRLREDDRIGVVTTIAPLKDLDKDDADEEGVAETGDTLDSGFEPVPLDGDALDVEEEDEDLDDLPEADGGEEDDGDEEEGDVGEESEGF
ncbi:MAG: DNA gyrase subunit A, partial [Lentisphaeria bacterium]|nr:DNA gyrase subunit A [Lentisphaeria bacterium]